MAAVSDYAEIVEKVLDVYTKVPYAHGDLTCEAIFDRPRGRKSRAFPAHSLLDR